MNKLTKLRKEERKTLSNLIETMSLSQLDVLKNYINTKLEREMEEIEQSS